MISIIVAVYQSEKFIRRCIESILIQTHPEFELLLINDGSLDDSGCICDEYASQDKRIRVIHKSNEGLSATRQRGLLESKGEYILFCDSDDWLEPNMLELLVKKANETDSDIVMCDVIREHGTHSVICPQKPSSLDCKIVLSELRHPLLPCLWNKLLRKNCILQNNISIPVDLPYSEDLYLMLKLLSYDVKINYVPSALYHYDKYSNEHSLTRDVDFHTLIAVNDIFECEFSSIAPNTINDMKCDTLWFAYNNANGEFYKQINLYKGLDSYMLFHWVQHPVKFWYYLVLFLSRNKMRRMAALLVKGYRMIKKS